MEQLPSKYDPKATEDKWYAWWMQHRMFESKPDEREPYTIVIPPPNVTGVLHMGHMLNNTIQDVLVRRARMTGKNACWVPGTDHASIATEAKVVAKLAAEGINKADLSRGQFLEHAWEWTHKHGGIILEQLKKLGASCDWSRTCFTMDDNLSRSVYKVFVDLYNKGMIYRGVRMVNWDPKAQTALSDEEVIHKEVQGKLYYLKYHVAAEHDPCEPTGDYIVIATTRPETIMGDTAVCVNPPDPRYAHLHGQYVIVPLIGRGVPVIPDEYVDIEFGTGCLKVTPAHDVNDYLLGEKYNLDTVDIFNDDGTLNERALLYTGQDRFDVRRQIEIDLREAGLLEKTEDYVNKVGFSERTDVPIEPKLSMQWFLKMEKLSKPALRAVMNDVVELYPPKFRNTYRHWMENIKDWCISRQLWWGHRIPAWYLPQGGFVVAENEEEALKMAREKSGNPNLALSDMRQDEDCLDTWFSSWLWPISVFDGINRPDNPDIKYYYPTSDLVTAPEILFFWVARMIIAGYEYMGDKPFSRVYLTGIVRDKLGRKMSKQLGNSPDPIELMNKYGADGVRMGMLLTSPAGNDLPFDEALCEQGRNFNNKIWNALRLIKGWKAAPAGSENSCTLRCSVAREWFESLLKKTESDVEDLFSKYRLSEALMLLYKLFWDEFSAWYLEIVKPEYGNEYVDEVTYGKTISFFERLLKLLHPFMPFITEELYHALEEREEKNSIMMQPLNKSGFEADDETNIHDFENVKEIIANIRAIRQQKNISPKEGVTLYVKGEYKTNYDEVIKKLGNVSEIKITDEKPSNSMSYLVGTTEFSIPVEINAGEEIAKLETELKYQEGFLASVMKKLGNERFVNSAPEQVVASERKKQADAESRIQALSQQLANLKK